jgi:hypothetical protein
MNKILVFILSLILLFLPFAVRAEETSTAPSFPSCPQAGGTVIASYDSGTHWIAGEDSLREGSDKVYQLEDGNVVQCFCPTDQTNLGIKTDWLDAKDMTAEEKQSYVDQGWILINNGADFGLEAHCYLAKNTSFSCNATPSPTPTCTPSEAPAQTTVATPEPTASPTEPPVVEVVEAASSSNDTSSTSNPAQGQVLSLTPSILPPTGSNQTLPILLTLIAAFFSLSYGIYLKIKN